jgi:hypothetical protein
MYDVELRELTGVLGAPLQQPHVQRPAVRVAKPRTTDVTIQLPRPLVLQQALYRSHFLRAGGRRRHAAGLQ